MSDDKINARRRYPRIISARPGDGLAMCVACRQTVGSDVELLGIDHGPGFWVTHVCGPCAVKCGFVTSYWPRPRPVSRPAVRPGLLRRIVDRFRPRSDR